MADIKIDTGIVKRGKSFRFTVYLGYDTNHKQIRKTTTFTPPEDLTPRKAEKLAKEEYLKFKNKCNGLVDFNENMRFKELTQAYLNIYAKNELKPITTYNYEHLINYHFMDYFGNKKLKQITPGMITTFFNTHTTTDKNGSEKPLIYPTAKKLYTILQSVFTFAVSQRFISESPCKNIILPNRQRETNKRKYLTEDELNRFLQLFDEYSSFNTIIKTLLFTGMRAGECLGLQWSDIDFTNRLIYVRRTLSDVGGEKILTDPKTKGSKRYIYMSETVYNLLMEHHNEQRRLALIVPNFKHPEMVFTSDTGNYKDRSCLNTSFRRYLKDTEFDFLTLHALRHCNATLLLNSGVDLKVVSEHLGHSDISVTADIYTDVLASTRQKTAQIIELSLTS